MMRKWIGGVLAGAVMVVVMAGGSTAEGDTSYTYTFDGAPGAPVSMYGMSEFDVQVHTRNHGPNCEAPGITSSVAVPNSTGVQVPNMAVA